MIFCIDKNRTFVLYNIKCYCFSNAKTPLVNLETGKIRLIFVSCRIFFISLPFRSLIHQNHHALTAGSQTIHFRLFTSNLTSSSPRRTLSYCGKSDTPKSRPRPDVRSPARAEISPVRIWRHISSSLPCLVLRLPRRL